MWAGGFGGRRGRGGGADLVRPPGRQRRQRFLGRGGLGAAFGEEDGCADRWCHQHRRGDRSGPVLGVDQGDRGGTLGGGGRRVDGERGSGGVRGRVGAADPGRVVGGEAGEAELARGRGGLLTVVARLGGHARGGCAGLRARLVLAAAGPADDRDHDEGDRDHDQEGKQLRRQRLWLARGARRARRLWLWGRLLLCFGLGRN